MFEDDMTPPLIARLVAEGRWPGTREEQNHWSLECPVSDERIVRLARGQTGLSIHLCVPPFASIASMMEAGDPFWSDCGDPDGIDPERAYLMGDFGLGSDMPIIADSRTDPARVLHLQWNPPRWEDNRWVETAPSLAELVRLLGI